MVVQKKNPHTLDFSANIFFLSFKALIVFTAALINWWKTKQNKKEVYIKLFWHNQFRQWHYTGRTLQFAPCWLPSSLPDKLRMDLNCSRDALQQCVNVDGKLKAE